MKASTLRMRRSVCLSLACLCLGAAPLSAREHWIKVSTAHFEMYTTNGENQAIQALQTFEQVRYFFLKNSKRDLQSEGRVRIIAFSSEKEYRPYRFNAGAFAYYQQSHERDYIVMQDIEPEHHRTAVHEYTHLIVQHLNLTLPAWLNEGIADFYSSLEPEGKKAMVGRPITEHAMVLGTRPWMDWNVLFAVNQESPYYNVPDMMQIFYAQSWALTHMIEMSPSYSPNAARFLATVASGVPTAEAFQKIYGKSVEEVANDVRAYTRQRSVRAVLFDVTLAKTELDPDISELSEFDTALALADLLSARPQTAAEARRRLVQLEKQNPGNIELQVSMGYLAWQQNNLDEARKHFGLAVDHGLKDPTLIYHYAQLLQGTNTSPETIAGLLSQVLAVQPDHLDARIYLAGTELNARHYGAALAALEPVHRVEPDHAYRFFAISAMARVSLKDFAGAKDYAERALKYAKAPDEQTSMQNLLTYIDRVNAPDSKPGASGSSKVTDGMAPGTVELAANANLPRVRGVTKAFECARGAFRLHLNVDGREMVFAMPPHATDVVVRNAGTEQITLNCGPMKPQNLTVVYKPGGNSSSDGVVAELVF